MVFSPPAVRSGRKFNGTPPLLPRQSPLAMVQFRTLAFRLLTQPVGGSRIEIKQTVVTDIVRGHIRTLAPGINTSILQVGETKPLGICFGGVTVRQALRRIVEVGASG